MGEGLTILTKLDPSGFVKGSQRLLSAVRSLNSKVSQVGRNTEKMVSQMANPLKRILPTIIGVGSAYGIISKAVSAFMQQNQELSSRMSSIWTALGNVIGPIITQIIDWVSTAVSYFLSFLKLLGVTGKSASQLSQGAKEANNSAKEMKKTLAGFDELNILNDDNNDNGGGGGSGDQGLKDIDPSEWMKKLADLLKNKMWDEAADMMIDKLNDIIYKIRDKAQEVGEKVGEYMQGIIHTISRVLNETDWKALGEGIGNFFKGLLKEVEGINFGQDLGKLLVSGFTIAFKILDGFLETDGLLGRIGNIVGEAIKGAFDAISEAIEGADAEKIGHNIADFFNNIDWQGIADSMHRMLKDAWDFAVELLHTTLSETDWEEIGSAIGDFFREIDYNKIAEDIKTLLEDAWNAALDLLKGILDDPEGENPLVQGIEALGEAVKKFCQEIPEYAPNLESNLKGISDILGEIVKWGGESFVPKALELIGSALTTLDSALDLVLPGLKELVEVLEKLVDFALEAATSVVNVADGAIEMAEFFTEKHDFDVFDEMQEQLSNLDQAYVRYGDSVRLAGEESDQAKERHQEYVGALKELESGLLSYGEGCENAGEAAEFLRGKIEEMSQQSYDSIDLQDGLTETVEQYVAMLNQQGEAMTSQSETISKMSEDIRAQADSVREMADSETQAAEAVASANETLDEVPGTTDAAAEGYSKVGDETKETSEETQVTTSEMVEILKADWDELGEHITEKATELKENVVQAMEDMRTELESTFSQLASDASTWGSDMMDSFIEGIRSKMPELEQAVSEVAQTTADYMQHSHPKKGPLADDYTWMPDMMDLFVSGIEGNQSKVISAVSNVASGVSDAFNIGNGMNGIQLPMSTAASGAFLPYNVGAQDSMFGSSGEDGFIARISGAIYDAVVTAMSDMQNVSGQRTAILEINGREFFRATYEDQQAVAREHGISLVSK